MADTNGKVFWPEMRFGPINLWVMPPLLVKCQQKRTVRNTGEHVDVRKAISKLMQHR